MSNFLVKEDHKEFIKTEEKPFLILFVLTHVEQIKQLKEEAEKIQTILRTRHINFLEQIRPELDKETYTSLEFEVLKSLLKKRKREEDTAAAAIAPDNSASTATPNTRTTDSSTTATITTTNTPRLLQANQREQVQLAFEIMDDQKKWKLTTGKYLEDVVYQLSNQYSYENLSHSWIVDLDDTNYKKYLSNEEITEVISSHPKRLPDISHDLDECIQKILNKYVELKSSNENDYLEAMISYCKDQLKKYDNKHACHTFMLSITNVIDNVICGMFHENASETEIMINLWVHLVDVQLKRQGKLRCRRGEISSKSSANRRLRFVDQVARKPTGKKADLLINFNDLEVSYGEASLLTDQNSKKNNFDKTKTVKVLKDMLDDLFEATNYDQEKKKQIMTVGFQFSKYSINIMYLDQVEGFCCRLKKTKTVTIDAEDIVPSFVAAYQMVNKAVAVCRQISDIVIAAQQYQQQNDFEEPISLSKRLQLPSGLQTPPRLCKKKQNAD
ncbi:uncharacterized protein B0P05DRAFT_570879 [Gilbertella persicaria]|uniref:uncharacterized protein n=1 Tax=Gilbertella persicaria TaxID=101096 RepID=UPI002221115C|nr:uncharacterized protein B0P05DRAFT_570879 [Gilbertella persicaria]KAI8082662.1 hypothetical protein B0P05DRAFT_570879 [Gilbertella persicaria]